MLNTGSATACHIQPNLNSRLDHPITGWYGEYDWRATNRCRWILCFYDLPYGLYTVKETQLPDWTTKVPASGEYVVDLAPSANEERNFGNCPNCSCDQIYLNLSQLPGSNDTNTYYLNISNNGPYCFNYIDIKVDTGQLLDWNLLLPNWTTSQQGPNFIRLSPTADYILPEAVSH